MSRSLQHQRQQAGFTLLEAAVVMAVLAVIMTVAVPNYRSHLQRQQLREAANSLLVDLRNAREMSVSQRTPMFVSFHLGPNWCWGVSQGMPCDCGPTVAGSAKAVDPATGRPKACSLTRHKGSEFPDVSMDGATDAKFEPTLGQAPQHGSTTFSSGRGQKLQVDLNAMGRAQVCGPATSSATPC